ncbi:unnamed protein product [Rotaria sp. Silwood2]|nr:unnamed protein product [Rotaria sp. Silwood2]CAF2646233.1 unnamed protein product [Rotaria sp. Silwood2]CAF2864342.1 unnamed protein product [Rotaria sp. Silwood2]CAF3038600.1 unnamed protein product [Rotaria sp. Silwood2]CAF3932758.1 unnamed protein product [Rotaria sp. Silwood2]
MYFFLLFNILALILQNCFGVHPGDPFPIDQQKSKILTSEDLLNANEIGDPINHEIPLHAESLADPFDSINEENFLEYIISTSIKSTPTTKIHNTDGERKTFDKKLSQSTIKSIPFLESHDNDIDKNNNFDKKLILSQESSTLSSIKSFIKIGRWKYMDSRSKEIRYWYEPEGGHMGFGWIFDGFIFQAYNKSESNTEPVYAFHSEIRGIWTNTIQMDPKPPIIGYDQWTPDGVSFYAYKTSMNSTELQPIVRYWNKLKPGTTDATETRISYIMIKTESAFSITPGDPFLIDIDNNTDSYFSLDSKYVSNKTISLSANLSSNESKSIEKYLPTNESSLIDTNKTCIDENTNSNLLLSSTLKPLQETLPIYKKHLVQIAQWKYSDPKTQQTRYWYHTAGSVMGDGWILDSILCQAYIRQKPDTIPIYAFHSEAKGIWTNTLQIDSTLIPIGNNQWKYDGTIFYAYKTSMNSSLLKPIWRYWNRINYGTEDVSEPRRSYLRMGDITEDDLPGWRLEHILFYAFPPDINVNQLITLK